MDERFGRLLDEIERRQRLAAAASQGPWIVGGIGDHGWSVRAVSGGFGFELGDDGQGMADARYLATRSATDALRDLAADYRLARLHAEDFGAPCVTCREHRAQGEHCETLRVMLHKYRICRVGWPTVGDRRRPLRQRETPERVRHGDARGSLV